MYLTNVKDSNKAEPGSQLAFGAEQVVFAEKSAPIISNSSSPSAIK